MEGENEACENIEKCEDCGELAMKEIVKDLNECINCGKSFPAEDGDADCPSCGIPFVEERLVKDHRYRECQNCGECRPTNVHGGCQCGCQEKEPKYDTSPIKEVTEKKKWLCETCRFFFSSTGFFDHVSGNAEPPDAGCENCPEEHQKFWEGDEGEDYIITECSNYQAKCQCYEGDGNRLCDVECKCYCHVGLGMGAKERAILEPVTKEPSYTTLNEIIEQLELCNYECEGGPLRLNVAFIALKKLAEKETLHDAMYLRIGKNDVLQKIGAVVRANSVFIPEFFVDVGADKPVHVGLYDKLETGLEKNLRLTIVYTNKGKNIVVDQFCGDIGIEEAKEILVSNVARFLMKEHPLGIQ